MRERFWIEGNTCVNKYIPCRAMKEYCEANREEIRERKKAWYEANRETLIEKIKIYQELNKEKLAAHRKVKVQCGCGTTHAHGNKVRHAKSQKHQLWLTGSTNHTQRCP